MKACNSIRIHEKDNVAIVINGVKKGETVVLLGEEYQAAEEIPAGHKMALMDLTPDAAVVKYGYSIGRTTCAIHKGQWIHSHNMATALEGILEYEYRPKQVETAKKQVIRDTFLGYRREDGTVGVRNEIWIIPTVSCVNHVVEQIAKEAAKRYAGLCDGIYALPHNAGCSQLGEDHKTTQQILASIVKHPNAGGVLLVSLGCENNNFHEFMPVLEDYNPHRIKLLTAQDVENEWEEGVRLAGELAEVLAGDQREEVPVSELKIGFKCGGSDSLSGVTANPLCGKITDRITGMGGTSILTEVPEMFGAEQILMNRADSIPTYHKVVDLINSFKQYYMDYEQPIYENPAPGNKEGGITTLEEKSLGCIQKGGSAKVVDTLAYGERATKPGLNLMNGPGNDSVSITNLLASGAQLLLFTTGRGNPLGTAIPSIKLATNTSLFERKKHWMDFNAGTLVEEETMEEASERLWNLVLDVASGRKQARNEVNGYRDIMIFKNGVLL